MTVQLLERKRHTNQFEHEMYRRATSHKMCIDPKTQTKQFLSIRYDFFSHCAQLCRFNWDEKNIYRLRRKFYSSSDCFIGTYRLGSFAVIVDVSCDTIRYDTICYKSSTQDQSNETKIDCYFGTGTYIRPI